MFKDSFQRTADPSPDILQAVDRMKSLHDGDRGFAEVVSLGVRSVPLLRELLFSREPSGLHHARCRATEALASLKAYEALEEFLRLEREIDDPVERLGEDTVISSAARAMARSHSQVAFNLLLDLAKRRVLSGVIAGLGSFKRLEAIPCLVGALAEDEVRLTAEAALREIGTAARGLLLRAAKSPRTGQTAPCDQRPALATAAGIRVEYRADPRFKGSATSRLGARP